MPRSFIQKLILIARKRSVFFFLLILLILTVVPNLSFVPVWDGWVFFQCYQTAAATGSLSCEGHSAFFHILLFSLPQLLDMGNPVYTHALMLGLVIGGLLCFRNLCKRIFGRQLSSLQLDIITFFLGLNPIVLAHITQPSLDLSLTILFVISLLLLLRQRFLVSALSGLAMMFTKETGVLLYGTSISLYVLLFLNPFRPENRTKLILLASPLLIFLSYMVFFPPFSYAGTNTWTEALQAMILSPLFDGYFKAQASSLFVINFSWLLMIIIMVSLVLRVVFYVRNGTNALLKNRLVEGRSRLFFYLLLLILTVFLTRIKFYNNPRYMLPILPLYIMVFADSIFYLFGKRKIGIFILLVVFLFMYMSYFHTFDPVAKRLFGTFKFGRHELLSLRSMTPIEEGNGRDELVYNREFMEIPYLTERLIQKVGFDKAYVVPANFTWRTVDFSSFDEQTGQRTARKSSVLNVVFVMAEDIVSTDVTDAYFIRYPNFYNVEAEQIFSKRFSFGSRISVEHNGYELEAVHLVAKR